METKIVELKVNTNLDQTNSDVTKLKSNLKGAEGGAKDFDKAIGTKKGGSFKELGGAIGDIIPSFGAASQGAGVLNKALLTLVANPIGLVIAGVALVLGSLYAIFKDFQPLVDKVEQSMAALGAVVSTIKSSFIGLLTGTKSLGEAFGGLGGSISEAAKEAVKLTKAQQDLDDAMEAQTITSALARAEINKLNVMLKDRTKTEEERLAIAKKSEKVQEDLFNKEKDLADKQTNILANKLAKKYKFSKDETKLLFSDFETAKALAESRGSADQELFDKFKTARLGQISIQDQATANLEKNQNKQDALLQAQEAKRDAQIAKQKASQDKSEADEKTRSEKAIADKKAYLDKANLIEDEINLKSIGTEQQKRDANILAMQNDLSKKVEIGKKYVGELQSNANAEKLINEELAESKIQNLQRGSAMLGQISDLIGQNTAAGKVAAVASATIDTYAAAQSAFANAQKNPISIIGPAYPYISAGLAIAGGLKNVKSILSVRTPKGGGGGSAPSAGNMGTPPSAPNFNVVGTSGQNQIAQTLNREQPPIKAYVVGSEVTTQQSLDRNIVQSASLG